MSHQDRSEDIDLMGASCRLGIQGANSSFAAIARQDQRLKKIGRNVARISMSARPSTLFPDVKTRRSATVPWFAR
jgi:hypothetical protein